MPLVPPSHTPLCTALGTPEIRVRPQHSPGLGLGVFVSHSLITPRTGLWGCLCLTSSSPPALGLGVFVSRSLSTSRTGHCGVPNLQSPQPLCSPETWVSPVLTPCLLWGISAVTVVAVPCPAQSCAPVLWGFNTHC